MLDFRKDGRNKMTKFTYKYAKPNKEKIPSTLCYGDVQEDSNFYVICFNEEYDGIVADIDAAEFNTWKKICGYLYKNYRKDIVEITTC